MQTFDAGEAHVRVYRAAEPNGTGLVWAHGGGFAFGDLDMPEAHWVAQELAARGTTVVSVDYRLAPVTAALSLRDDRPLRDGVHFPAPSDDILSAWSWTLAHADELGIDIARLALGGASAGGNLVAGAVLRLLHGDDGSDAAPAPATPALLVLAYPTLLAVQPAPDARLRAALDADPESDRFGPDAVRGMYENYLGGPVEDAPIAAVPGLARPEDLTQFPPTLMIDSEVDELRVSAEHFAATLATAGRQIDVVTQAGTTHGTLNRPDDGPAASDAIDLIVRRLAALGH